MQKLMRACCCIWQCIMTASSSLPRTWFKDMPHKSQPSTCTGQCSSPVEMLGLAASSHLLSNSSGSPMRGSFSGGLFHIGLPVASLISHLPTSAMLASFQNHSDSCVGSRQPGGWWRWRCTVTWAWAGWAGRLGRCGFETSLRLFPQRLSQTPRQRVGSSRTDFLPGRAFYRVWAMHLTLSTG
jgi:hypothetical protein